MRSFFFNELRIAAQLNYGANMAKTSALFVVDHAQGPAAGVTIAEQVLQLFGRNLAKVDSAVLVDVIAHAGNRLRQDWPASGGWRRVCICASRRVEVLL